MWNIQNKIIKAKEVADRYLDNFYCIDITDKIRLQGWLENFPKRFVIELIKKENFQLEIDDNYFIVLKKVEDDIPLEIVLTWKKIKSWMNYLMN